MVMVTITVLKRHATNNSNERIPTINLVVMVVVMVMNKKVLGYAESYFNI